MNSVATLLPFPAARARRRPHARQALPGADGLYARVFEDILEGRFAAGLSEELLMRTYTAGRSEVRRVVTRLTRQRIIHARPNQRAHVAQPDAEQIRQVLQARRMAEYSTIERVCATITDLALESLRGLVARERQSCESNRQKTAIRLGTEFHLELARMAGNTPLVHFLEELVPLTGLALMQHPPRTEDWRIREAIVNAMENGDVVTAMVELTAYLERLAALQWS
ncbi:GntR family transcriptional regulator [Pseudomonas asplenii]|uniref:GntR family transcriptional regulator n=1 Tax=Pseudomonas asplenii TaxID=53407 RepID=UPI0006B67A3B|nr:GntR family transcriptional regulator [Pseudomonas fuscovaginae]KPA96729.1 transcriptional regulator [Pseudomonas fuscovaginae]